MYVYKVEIVQYGFLVHKVFISANNDINIKSEHINTSLFNEEEYDTLLNNLIEETLNEDTLKLYRKYTALKHITD